jgi:general stress protein 26
MRNGSDHVDTLHGAEAVAKLAQLTKGHPFAMVTTVDAGGHLVSRPLTTQDLDDDGRLWFFVGAESGWVKRFDGGSPVNVAYVDGEGATFVSVSGKGELVEDRAKAEERWSKANEAWFPGGPTDPDLRLLRIDVEHADYWDATSSKVVRLASMAKAAVTGSEPKLGERGDLEP